MNLPLVIAGKYRLERLLGKGAIGDVYFATDQELQRPVAVKVLKASQADDVAARGRFAREAKVAAQLRHPNSVGIIDFGDHEGQLFLVMDYLEGRDVRAAVAEGPLGLERSLHIAHDVASALLAAHEIGLVHRDIKPENIFLVAHGDGERARVVDFGLAFIAAPADGALRALGRLTEDGMLGGTPAYMSPEQIRGIGVGPSADTYALGCVLYEMLAGEPPFVGHIGDLLTRHAYAAPLALRHREPPVAAPPDLDDLVMSMLSKSAALRPPMHEIVSLLDNMSRTLLVGPRGHAARMTREERSLVAEDAIHSDATSSIQVNVIGAVSADLRTSLRVNGIEVVANPMDGAAVLVTEPSRIESQPPGRTLYVVRPCDIDGLVTLVKRGVSDVVTEPVSADELSKKIRRLVRLPRPAS